MEEKKYTVLVSYPRDQFGEIKQNLMRDINKVRHLTFIDDWLIWFKKKTAKDSASSFPERMMIICSEYSGFY